MEAELTCVREYFIIRHRDAKVGDLFPVKHGRKAFDISFDSLCFLNRVEHVFDRKFALHLCGIDINFQHETCTFISPFLKCGKLSCRFYRQIVVFSTILVGLRVLLNNFWKLQTVRKIQNKYIYCVFLQLN